MNIEAISVLLALVLAISLVTERVITTLKTAIPKLGEDQTGGLERARRVLMQLLAFAAA